ncbi:hypothetical protein [Desulfosporosinus orientis]|uniref:hypothetical protein n=1 Tax=Desulfosporosinus orientis TaxID=1563 RepID=UPI00130530A7|nr:hypothetical protein [Desulfosporosinus orientis]
MQKYPEVRTRSRTVQRGSGGTRRRVLKKRSSPEPDRRTDPLSAQEAFFKVVVQKKAKIVVQPLLKHSSREFHLVRVMLWGYTHKLIV